LSSMEALAFSNNSGPVELCSDITSFAIVGRWQSNHSASPAIDRIIIGYLSEAKLLPYKYGFTTLPASLHSSPSSLSHTVSTTPSRPYK
jgi:hypothetical protein